MLEVIAKECPNLKKSINPRAPSPAVFSNCQIELEPSHPSSTLSASTPTFLHKL